MPVALASRGVLDDRDAQAAVTGRQRLAKMACHKVWAGRKSEGEMGLSSGGWTRVRAQRRLAMRVLRALYRNNPFYLVSALLVLFGLKAVFPPEGSPAYDWVLMGLLDAYTSLLAGTACFLVVPG